MKDGTLSTVALPDREMEELRREFITDLSTPVT
jgi:hypothetical protein